MGAALRVLGTRSSAWVRPSRWSAFAIGSVLTLALGACTRTSDAPKAERASRSKVCLRNDLKAGPQNLGGFDSRSLLSDIPLSISVTHSTGSGTDAPPLREEPSCSVQLLGNELVVASHFSQAMPNNSSAAPAREPALAADAECAGPALESGSYWLRYGGLRAPFDVPSLQPLCFDAD